MQVGDLRVLTLAYAYYRNPGMLVRHIAAWRQYEGKAKTRLRFVIIDDGSPSDPAAPIVRELGVGLPIAVYGVREDIPWNWDGARNLAMTVAESEWVWLLDSDRLVDPDQAAKAAIMRLSSGTWYRPNQRFTDGAVLDRPHPNCFIVAKTDFWKTGGYDEDFRGFWDKDKTFRQRLSAVADPIFRADLFMTGYRRMDVGDCDTRMGRRDSTYHLARAPAALLAKANGPFYVAENPLRFTWERQI